MVKDITKNELLEMKRYVRDIKIVDVLNEESFQKKHIPGAISIPLASIGKDSYYFLNKNDNIIIYCSSFTCEASTLAARKLTNLGYKNIYIYKGGLEDFYNSSPSSQREIIKDIPINS